MNISGIRPWQGTYNRITNSAVQAPAETEVTADLATQARDGVSTDAAADRREAPAREQSFGAYDYAQQYNPKATYDLKGADAALDSLDVENAISDMQKDAVLKQYQYFVDPSGQNRSRESAADLHPLENFSF